MALKSESASQMDHIQALEKVSPKLASRERRYRSVSSFFALRLYILKSHSVSFLPLFGTKKLLSNNVMTRPQLIKKWIALSTE